MKPFILFFGLLFISCTSIDRKTDSLNLESKLIGKWIATAFDGELHEEWKLGENGWMEQQGFYIEKADTSYSAKTRIEKVENDIILFSIIKNSYPKIFQSVEFSEDKIVFQNKDYKNPFQVTYQFINSNKYKRTIEGFENDSLVIYSFNFEKVKN